MLARRTRACERPRGSIVRRLVLLLLLGIGQQKRRARRSRGAATTANTDARGGACVQVGDRCTSPASAHAGYSSLAGGTAEETAQDPATVTGPSRSDSSGGGGYQEPVVVFRRGLEFAQEGAPSRRLLNISATLFQKGFCRIAKWVATLPLLEVGVPYPA